MKGYNTNSRKTCKDICCVSLRGRGVIVKSINTEVIQEFASLTEAAKYIGVSRPAVKKYLDTGKLIQGIYLASTKQDNS